MLFLNALSFLVVSRYESDKKQDKTGACFAQNTKFIIFFTGFVLFFTAAVPVYLRNLTVL